MKAYLTIPEAAALTGRSKRTIRRWVTEHRIPAYCHPDGIDLRRYVKAVDVQAAADAADEYRANPTRPTNSRTIPM